MNNAISETVCNSKSSFSELLYTTLKKAPKVLQSEHYTGLRNGKDNGIKLDRVEELITRC